MKHIELLLAILLIIPSQLWAVDLPGPHSLKKNNNGEYYVENSNDIIMIEASIISLGYNDDWIVACIANLSIDSDAKRMVFINMKYMDTTDTLNKENWEYFKSVYDGLGTITLEKLQDSTCP